MKISIIFPAYNEEKRIGATLVSFRNQLLEMNLPFELIVVDDGSSDGTVALVREMEKEMPGLRLLPMPVNRGKGHAVKAGMLFASGTIRLFSDADGSTPATEIPKLIAPLLEGKADLSIGSRYHKDSEVLIAQPRYRRAWSRLSNRIVQRALLPGIVDPHCGFKAYTGEAAEKIYARCETNGWSFDLEALAIAQKLNLRLAEVPVKWMNDERSKGRISQLPNEIKSVYRIRKKLANESIR